MGMMCQVMAAKITAKASLWGSLMKGEMDILIGQITDQKKPHENGSVKYCKTYYDVYRFAAKIRN